MQLKRILITLLVAIMMLSMAVVAVSAADTETFDIAVESTSTADVELPKKPGDTLEIKVVIENNPGAAQVEIDLEYDPAALVYDKITNGDTYTFGTPIDATKGEKKVLIVMSTAEASDVAKKGTAFTVSFKVADGYTGNNAVNVSAIAMKKSLAGVSANTDAAPIKVDFAASTCNYNIADAEVVAPTCVAEGYTLLRCIDAGCTESIKVNVTEIDPENHTNIVDVPATATHYAGKKCDDCGTIVEGCGTTCTHPNFEEIEALDATCTEAGYTAGKQCTDCNAIFEGYLYVAPLGHSDVLEDVAEVPATCTKAGVSAGKACSVCKAVVEGCEPTALAEHDVEELAAVDATCTSIGLTKGEKCKTCGTITVAQEIVPVVAHTEKDLEAVEATCANAGLTAGKVCEICGEVTVPQEDVPAKAHTVVDLEAVDATCISTGLTAGQVCEVCDAVIVAQEILPITTHTEVAIDAVEATCTAAGSTAGTKCSVCDVVIVAPEVVQPKGHTEEVIPAVEATKDNDGSTEGKKCTVCGEITDATGVIPAIATSLAWLWVLIAAVVVIGALVAVYFFVLRKKS